MQEDQRFMRMAIELATSNVLSGRGGPFGAVIVREGAVVATGANQVSATNDPTAHAEITALRNACASLGVFELAGCTLYSSCEPCPMCLSAIYWSRCTSLVFANTARDAADAGFDDLHLYQQLCLPAAERDLPSTTLLREEALESFKVWGEYAARIDY